MLQHVGAHRHESGFAFRLVGRAKRRDAFERKLGINNDGAAAFGSGSGNRDGCRSTASPERIERGGSASAMIASICCWPNAPRACLLARISCRLTTWPESAAMFFWASSMMLSLV